MPSPASLELETRIKSLSKLGFTYSRIIKEVKGQGFSISKCLISKVLNNKGNKRESVAAGLLPPSKDNPLKC